MYRNEEGRRVALVRHLMGLSQKEVAEKIGITQGYLSRMETGRRPLAMAEEIAKVLGVPVKYLKEGGEIRIVNI